MVIVVATILVTCLGEPPVQLEGRCAEEDARSSSVLLVLVFGGNDRGVTPG